MTPVFFVLLTFFSGTHAEVVRECPTWTCVEQSVEMAARYGLYRYRGFGAKPAEMGDTSLVPPLLDYWLQ